MSQKFFVEIFREWLKIRKIRKIKDPRKFNTIRCLTIIVLHRQSTHSKDSIRVKGRASSERFLLTNSVEAKGLGVKK